ncbi:MAG: transporter [Sphingomonas adhaesiva]|uniref:transporter n=1 Tax=Sphingomonas adhaesiva TaxID=28212 RepID=UPI002FF6A722
MTWRPLLLLLGAVGAMVPMIAAAQGDDPIRFCPNRPSLGASGCTTLPGQVQIEMSSLDWERGDDGETRTDTMLAGDIVARFGVGPATELQLGWTALGGVRMRDRTSGAVTRQNGVGDVTLGVRQALSGPDGKGLSSALQPYVTLPVGGGAIGAGDWSAGVVVPVAYAIDDTWSVDFTGQLAAQADQDRHGRHVDVSGVVGLGYALTGSLTAVAEFSVERDDDPAGVTTPMLGAASLAWQPGAHTQLDVLAVAGLNHDAPDLRLVLGGAVGF